MDSSPLWNYQEMSKRTSWQRRVPEENSRPTMSASVKRKLIRALTMPRLQRDDNHLLSWKQQVVLVRLCTGHNRMNSHMHGKLNLAPSPTCPCGQEDQTTEHVLQSYKRRRVACQHSPDDQTLRLQAGAGEDDVIHVPSGLDHVDCKRHEEEEAVSTVFWHCNLLISLRVPSSLLGQ